MLTSGLQAVFKWSPSGLPVVTKWSLEVCPQGPRMAVPHGTWNGGAGILNGDAGTSNGGAQFQVKEVYRPLCQRASDHNKQHHTRSIEEEQIVGLSL